MNFSAVNAGVRIEVSPFIYEDIQLFISEMRSSDFDPKTIRINTGKEADWEILEKIYDMKE